MLAVNASPQVLSAAWAALSKIAARQADREHLSPGATHRLHLRMTGRVDVDEFSQELSAVLNIGHDQERAASATPEPPHLVAFLLSKLNQHTRNRILRELPEAFAAAGNRLPEIDDSLINSSKNMLKRLRAKRTVVARGPISCQYQFLSPHVGDASVG